MISQYDTPEYCHSCLERRAEDGQHWCHVCIREEFDGEKRYLDFEEE